MKLKTAVAQIPSTPGRVGENLALILSRIEKAKAAGADLVVFPELSVPGYLAMDLCFNRAFLEEQKQAVDRIAEASRGIASVVGFIRREEGLLRPGGRPALYNSAAFINEGRVVGFQDKILLPDYNIFDEHRYFLSGVSQRVFSIKGIPVGIGICEDLWSKNYSRDPLKELRSLGSEIFINISASPFETGKFAQRLNVIIDAVQTHKVPLVYANLVGSYDGFDGEVVFDGRSVMISSDGSLLSIGKAFQEDLVFGDPFSDQPVSMPEWREIDEIHDALVTGIRSYFRRHGFTRAFIGISGGIDSAVVAALACTALGSDNVVGVTLPSRYSSDGTRADALKLCTNLGCVFRNFLIEKPFGALLEVLKEDPEFSALPEDVTEENIQPRLRMAILYALANKLGGIVLNTGNKTELALGYCTIYGDMAGGLGVVADLNKARVYELAACINEREGREVIPKSIINRPPTAELRAGQLDEHGMGAPPQILAPLVDALVEGMSYAEALERFQETFEPELIARTWKTLHSNEWKRRQASPGIRVTGSAFGHGRRVPLAHGFMG